MSVIIYALYVIAALSSGLIGTIIHELTHAVTAAAVGRLINVSWRGGVFGALYIDYQAGPAGGWRDELVRKAPLGVGLLGVGAVLVTSKPSAVWWWLLSGMTLGCLWTSPADLFTDAAAVADDHA